MRAHKFIEAVEEMGGLPPLKDKAPASLMDVGSAIQFDFGDVTPIPDEEWIEMQNYAGELIDEGLFRLPFNRCFYSFKVNNVDNSICVEQHGDKLWFLMTVGMGHMSIFAVMVYCVSLEPSGGKNWINIENVVSLPHPLARRFFQEKGAKVASEMFGNMISDGARSFLSLTMMLSAHGVEQIVAPPPHKLNKARARAGKPPIGEIREIIIRQGKKTYSVSGQESGLHASRRLHWRRGHLRKLPSGKVTNVRPCLVGSVGEARQPSYVVEAI